MFSRLIPSWAKKDKENYSSVKTLMSVFFGQDFEIFGDSVEDIMESYFATVNDISCEMLSEQVDALLSIPDDKDLEAIMSELAENQFRPEPWGETWRSYLSKVKSCLDKR
ncbi:contact-dependent growth inhibition system immunity protein [Brenneria tiliae]|uniref:Contact-dependent growth inhibition system immunity protein n=1 Tax=Brenneria tiliae TaxID=2914984 RepID=A0ABT0MQQ2_9GAMM|nr:contact-dependent growth inhibition system immunity protein [Brenneria tiliae]MCL2892122.1 contact-dependent growth inhibition system immunity protein [Brenneria tiliae]MCL2896774.1 contact-dependent growth inhibition system immunity protein [Brenneria tiliae]MCL2901243.1 contact-dependent growth inhibition system immunity protein [Brenneria tiliae]